MLSDDRILQVEVSLDKINILFAKSIANNDTEITGMLSELRHTVYYTKCDYDTIQSRIEIIRNLLKKYD